MYKYLLMCMAMLMVPFFCVQSTSAKSNAITLTNQTGRTVCTLYVSPVTYDWWYPDVLSGKMIASNESFTFPLEWSENGMYDVMAQDCLSDAITTVFSVNLSAGNAYTLRYNQITQDSQSSPAPSPSGGGSGVPCPSTGAWPPGCILGSGSSSTPSPVSPSGGGSGVPCPSTGAWPPGCIPGGGGGGGTSQSAPPSGGGSGVPCPSTGAWPPGCIPGGSAGTASPSAQEESPTPIRHEQVDFILRNNSSSVICGFYLIIDGQPNWGINYLPSEVYTGKQYTLSAQPGTYDIIVSECSGVFARFDDHVIYEGLVLLYEK